MMNSLHRYFYVATTAVLPPAATQLPKTMTEDLLRPSVTINLRGLPCRLTNGEVRVEVVTIGNESFDMRRGNA